MRRFTRLFTDLDHTTRSSEKVEALRRYFEDVDPGDAAWALALLSGRRGRRPVSTTHLRSWVAREAELPLWMVEECYDVVGDLAETLALLLPDSSAPAPPAPTPPALAPENPSASSTPSGPSGPSEPSEPSEPFGPSAPSLREVMEGWVLPLAGQDPEEQERRVREAWQKLKGAERFLYHKFLTGGFRVGVGPKLVTRGLALAVGLEPAVLAHRLTGRWEPSAETFRQLVSHDPALPDPGQPYPFMLAHALAEDPGAADLGNPDAWALEWKWDGIRAQLLHREGELLLWSRGEEVITPAFPEIAEAGRALPPGTVLDGEILPWKDDVPLPFGELQRRLGRKAPGARILAEIPTVFLAYDLLEEGGRDLRGLPFHERRAALEALWTRSSPAPAERHLDASASVPASAPASAPPRVLRLPGLPLLLAPLVEVDSWEEAGRLRDSARERRVEGLMLKGRDTPYAGGRPRGAWWKWKAEPFTLDVVLLHARKGHGRRASLFTDFTFGVWDGEALVPVASAYSGLTDAEFRQVDRWIRGHVTERFGPVRSVEPGLVFELAFEGIRSSSRHRSGVALRFPRMARWRQDKTPDQADTLDTVLALLAAQAPPKGSP